MGLSIRKKINLGNGTSINLSKKGVSVSQKIGNTTINSRGNVHVNLGHGISYRKKI